MNVHGIGVSPGKVIGPVRHMPRAITPPEPGQRPTASPEEGVQALKDAAQAVKADLATRSEKAHGDAKDVLKATSLMATDSALIKPASKAIEAGETPEWALWSAAEKVSGQLQKLGGYMAERVRDVKDVRARIVAELRGIQAPGVPVSAEPFVLLAEDLAPADTAVLDASSILALVTEEGGPQSHTAILARSLGIPAVVAARGSYAIEEDAEVFVDGVSGLVVSGPGEVERSTARSWAEAAAQLASFDGHGRLSDGHEVPLLANVGTGADALAAREAGAEGIGLFRTEFLFLGREIEPSIADQVKAYAEVFSAFEGRKVVVRTLDAGADKPLPFLTDASEPNPALGVRGYRTSMRDPEVLTRQLQAIAEAAAGSSAEVWVMAPMISVPSESHAFAQVCAAAGLRTPGVMIEVPAAAVTADRVLANVEFASIGTNDLTQYTMAADRQLGTLAGIDDAWQPAVLSMIRATVVGAAGKPVGVCGEAAADPALAVVLVGLGVSTLSMTARALPAVGRVLKDVDLAEARRLGDLALNAAIAEEGRAAVREHLPVLVDLGL